MHEGIGIVRVLNVLRHLNFLYVFHVLAHSGEKTESRLEDIEDV